MRDGVVYFIRAIDGTGPVKIGYSAHPERRWVEMMRWSPVELEIILEIPGTSRLECNIHSCFADDHSHFEWFHPSDRLLAAIEKMQAGVPGSEAIDLSDIRGNVRFKMAEATRIKNGNPPPWVSRKWSREQRRKFLESQRETA